MKPEPQEQESGPALGHSCAAIGCGFVWVAFLLFTFVWASVGMAFMSGKQQFHLAMLIHIAGPAVVAMFLAAATILVANYDPNDSDKNKTD